MKRLVLLWAVAVIFSAISLANVDEQAKKNEIDKPAEPQKEIKDKEVKFMNPVVRIITTKGEILVELDAKKAPISVANFLSYVNDKFYDGTIFHRVIKDFMIQGGGMTPDMQKKKTKAPIKNEAANGLKNKRGTIAMARTNAPNSATSQFFINHKDNAFLDYSPRGIGYAVFGKVIKGMDVVDAIAVVPTRKPGDVPVGQIVITSVTVVDVPGEGDNKNKEKQHEQEPEDGKEDEKDKSHDEHEGHDHD